MVSFLHKQSDLCTIAKTIQTLPMFVIVPTEKAVRNLQSVFPCNSDITPFIADIVDDMVDKTNAVSRMQKTISVYHDGVLNNTNDIDEFVSRTHLSRSERLVGGLESGILIEQSCMDIFDMINFHGLRAANRFLCYKLRSLQPGGVLLLQKHFDFEEFCDEFFGRI
jgi:hypothetical protein